MWYAEPITSNRPERAVAVEDHLAVARRFDHDRPLSRALRRQQIGAVERQPVRIDVVVPIALVKPGMDEKGVARLRLVERDDVPVTGADIAVVRGHQAREVRILLRSIRRPGQWIDVDRAAAGRGLRLRPRAHLRRSGPPFPSRHPDPSSSNGLRIPYRAEGRGCFRQSGPAPCTARA